MKKHMFHLMVSAVIFTTNPLFAMDPAEKEESHFAPGMLVIQEMTRSPFSGDFYRIISVDGSNEKIFNGYKSHRFAPHPTKNTYVIYRKGSEEIHIENPK